MTINSNETKSLEFDLPKSITKEEAEKLVRSVISKHLGEQMPENLFKDSVDQLMEDINGEEVH